VGHSYGGGVAWSAASLASHRVAAVVLLADPQDALVPVDTGRRLARALPDARLQLVPGAGHHLPTRAPDAVADAIAAFLAAVEDPAGPG